MILAAMPLPSRSSILFGLVGVPLGAGIAELVHRDYAQSRITALAGRGPDRVRLANLGLALSADWRFDSFGT